MQMQRTQAIRGDNLKVPAVAVQAPLPLDLAPPLERAKVLGPIKRLMRGRPMEASKELRECTY